MDMIGKESLEAMLSEFEGTILFVSHDRYFVNKIADSLIVFNGSNATHLPFTYEEYLAKRDTLPSTNSPTEKKIEVVKSGKEDYNRAKERAKQERRLAKVNQLISELEVRIDEKTKEQSLEINQSNYELLCSISQEIEELENQLLALLEECEELENALK